MSNNGAFPPDTETCGCCDGADVSTPGAITNRPGLNAIAYRIGTYAQFKESMVAGLSSADAIALADLRTRETDDYTLGLCDAVACAADVLTFYQERIANESYLRTATERVSLQELARLIAYRLRPGVAAETWLAFALEMPQRPPPGMRPDPGAFVTGIPEVLTLAAGLQVQSVPGPDERPQIFETVEELSARPAWNVLRPWLAAPVAPGVGATEMWVQGIANDLKAGDVLVFSDPDFRAQPTSNTNWDFRLISTVDVEAAAQRTRVTWREALAHVSSGPDSKVVPEVHVLRRRAAVFGHNAPLWKSMNESFRIDYSKGTSGDKNAPDWPDFTISESPARVTGGGVDLDSVVDAIQAGGLLLLTRVGFDIDVFTLGASTIGSVGLSGGMSSVVVPQTMADLYVVDSVTETSRAAFAVSGKVTRIGLQGKNLDRHFSDYVRDTTVHAQSERLTLAPYPVTARVHGDSLPLAVTADGLHAGRRLIVTGLRADGGGNLAHPASIVSAAAVANGTLLTITPPLPADLQRDSVLVYANVASARHGETVAQILGAGDASQPFQRFELKRMPLTYRSAANDKGSDSELSVRVGDIEWTEKATMFGAAENERVYSLDTDEHGRAWVVFGDGVHGARLPSGVNNVRATYRQGLGQQGNVGAEKLTQLITRPLGLKGVSNALAAQGGTDPEPVEQARRTMPLGTRTLGRAVSLLDYEDFALAFTGVAKAQARALNLTAGPAVAITVAGQDGAALSASNPLWNNLWLALKASGDPHVNIALLSFKPGTFRLGLGIRRDPRYARPALFAAVEARLRAHFSFGARELAQPVFQSDVIAVAHSVPGVVAVDIDFLYGGAAPSVQTRPSCQTRLLASSMRVENGIALPAELLTLDSAPFDRLVEMT